MVIGAGAIGNGSNTATIGNTSLLSVHTSAPLLVVNGSYCYISAREFADDATFDLPDSKSGFGTIQAGDDLAYVRFAFKADGTVRLIESNGSVAAANTDSNLCVFDNGSNVRIANRLDGAYWLRLDIKYSGN